MQLIVTESTEGNFEKTLDMLDKDASLSDIAYAQRIGFMSFKSGLEATIRSSSVIYIIVDQGRPAVIGGVIENIEDAQVWGHVSPYARYNSNLKPHIKAAVDHMQELDVDKSLYAMYPLGNTAIAQFVKVAGFKPEGEPFDHAGTPHMRAWRD